MFTFLVFLIVVTMKKEGGEKGRSCENETSPMPLDELKVLGLKPATSTPPVDGSLNSETFPPPVLNPTLGLQYSVHL